jgi:hypothetical protein
MPKEYIVQQAPFDAAARELARSARLNQAKEIRPLLAEMRTTCQNCHETFQVALPDSYREWGFGGKAAAKETSDHGR